MKILLAAVVFLGLAILAMSVRLLFIKGGKFSKKCSTAAASGEKDRNCVCGTEGGNSEGECQYRNEHHKEEQD